MKTLKKLRGVGVIFLSVLMLSGGCRKEDSNPQSEISHNDSTALYNIFADISKEYPTMLDIAPIRLPDVLVNFDNENMKAFIQSIEDFNNLIKNPQDIPSTGQKSVMSTNYTKHCETFGDQTECTFTENHGDYQIKVVQLIRPEDMNFSVSYSGVYDGYNLGDDYLIQNYYFTLDGKYFQWIIFRLPDPPESAGENMMYYEMKVKDEKKIYTPWGTELQRKLEFTSLVYYWDNIKNENHEWLLNKLEFDDNILNMTTANWSLKKEAMYVSWVATYDFDEMEGEWCAFDDDGIVIECGPIK